jgi:hypothetical protein
MACVFTVLTRCYCTHKVLLYSLGACGRHPPPHSEDSISGRLTVEMPVCDLAALNLRPLSGELYGPLLHHSITQIGGACALNQWSVAGFKTICNTKLCVTLVCTATHFHKIVGRQ